MAEALSFLFSYHDLHYLDALEEGVIFRAQYWKASSLEEIQVFFFLGHTILLNVKNTAFETVMVQRTIKSLKRNETNFAFKSRVNYFEHLKSEMKYGL